MYNNYLIHHGIKGQKWGVRRYQNEDGTLTDAGRKRYNTEYNSTTLDKKGNVISTKRGHYDTKGMNYTLANGAAKKAVRAYRNDTPVSKRSSKDELSVMGNAFDKAMREAQLVDMKYDIKNNWHKTYNRAVDNFNPQLEAINKKYDGYTFDDDFSGKIGQAYVKEVNKAWQTTYAKAIKEDYGADPMTDGYEYVESFFGYNRLTGFIKK